MNEVFLLTKILLKSSKSNTKKPNTGALAKFFTFIAFLFVYTYLAAVVGYICYQAIISLLYVNAEKIFLNLCFMGLLGFSILQTVFTSINVLFFSKDLDMLLPHPINPYKIIMAKFNCLVVSQYIMYACIFLPALVVYGYLLNLGVVYYVYTVFILLLFPIIPVVCVSLLITIIMKFTKIIKNKETVQYLSTILAIFILIIMMNFTGHNNEITNEELAKGLIETNITLEKQMVYLPNINFALSTLNNYDNMQGLNNFSCFILQSLIIYILVSLITSKFYVKTVTALMGKGNKTKRNIRFNYKKNKVIKTYVSKEIKNLVRNPIFFMQCVIPPLLFPFIFLIPSISSVLNNGDESIIFVNFISNYINTPFGLIGSIEILVLLYIFNFATITSISRDGSDAKVIKYLPIDLSKQLTYKTILGIIFNFVSLICIITIIKVIFDIKTLTLVYIAILGIIINIFNNTLVIIVDLKNPKTDWITEYTVVKQNLNMFYQLVINTIECGFLLLALFIKDLNMCFLVVSLTFIILTILVKSYININKQKLFEKIY